MINKNGLAALVVVVSGCYTQSDVLAPVEDRTGGNGGAGYDGRVVSSPAPGDAGARATPYVASPPASSFAPLPAARQPGAVGKNSAVASLMSIADVKIRDGQHDQALVSLERALRHDAMHAGIWSKLAEVRILQQDYEQAEVAALKSNALSNNNKPLMSKNWRTISKSRRLRGDAVGADEAEVRAYQLGK